MEPYGSGGSAWQNGLNTNAKSAQNNVQVLQKSDRSRSGESSDHDHMNVPKTARGDKLRLEIGSSPERPISNEIYGTTKCDLALFIYFQEEYLQRGGQN